MTGSYRSLNFEELIDAHSRLSDAASYLRPRVDTPSLDEHVYQAAIGPTEVSTSVALVPVSTLPIWDVNGYYRACGVSWPYRVTRRELTRIYNESGGPNSNDHYAAYAFQRLRDSEFRQQYDRRPLGPPMDDKYRWEEMFRMAALWAAQHSEVTGMVVTTRDVLGEDITSRMEAQEEAERQGDAIESRLDNDAARDAAEHDDEPQAWPYAYYLWGSRCDDEQRLAAWQQLLIDSFARQGLSLQMAVGYFDRAYSAAARWRHRNPEGRLVEIIFLNDGVDPTADLADVVVGTYHNRPYGTPLEQPIYLQHLS